MRRLAANDNHERASAQPRHTLMTFGNPVPPPRKTGRALRRPDMGFLAQLLVSTDPTLWVSRTERTRSAVAHYAAATRRI